MIQFKVRPHTRKIMLHDSHTTPDLQKAVGWVKWTGRKMGLLESGYHFVIDRDGSRHETRPMALIGAACQGHDLDTIHVCLIGGLTFCPDVGSHHSSSYMADDNFTDAQWEKLFETVQWLKKTYAEFSGETLTFIGHSEAKRHHTTEHGGMCPPVDMGDVRANYQQWVLQKGN
jgi:N-acetylmuramoyl-L-alanine amidase